MRYEPVIRSMFQVTSVSGDEFLCMCRWHADTSQGHLYVNGRKGAYLCMSCGAKGWLDNMHEALPQTGTDDVRERIARYRAAKVPSVFKTEAYLRQFDIPHPYWTEERGLPADIVKRFGLGYTPMYEVTDREGKHLRYEERMTLPLRDSAGRVLGVTYRRLDDGKPKYLHPKGFPIGRHLYGAWLLDGQKKVALVEGQVDAIRCWSERVPAVATMGARLTRDQVKVLQQANVRHAVLMLDNDNAGVKGTLQVVETLQGAGIRATVGWYRPYWSHVHDPDGLSGQRLRKMYHSGLEPAEWAVTVLQQGVPD